MSLRRSKRARTQAKVAYTEPKSDESSEFDDSDSSSSADESASSSDYSSQDTGRSPGNRSHHARGRGGGRGRGTGARKKGKKSYIDASVCTVPDLMTISAPSTWVASQVRQQRGGSPASAGAAAAAAAPPSASSDGEADGGVVESNIGGADGLAAEISAFFDAFGGALHFDPAALAERVRALEREAELARLLALPKSSFKVFSAIEDDTPRNIAARSGVSLEQLLALNSESYEGLRPTSRLRRGTKLLLPPAADAAADAAEEESVPQLLARAIAQPRTDAVATAMLNATHMVLLQPVLRQVAANAEATWATRQEKALQYAKSKERSHSNVVMPDVSGVPLGLSWPQFTTYSAGQYVRDELSLRWKAYRAAEQRRSGGLGSPDVPDELTIDPPLNVLNWRELCRQYVAARLQAMDVTALVAQETHPETFVRNARTASAPVAVAPPSVDLHTAVGLDWEQYPAMARVSRFDDVCRAVTSEGVYIPHHNQFQGSFAMRLARPGLGRIGAAENAVGSVGAGRREALRSAMVVSAAQRELDRELRAVAFERKTMGLMTARSGAASDSASRSEARASAPLWDAEAYGSCASDAARSVRESASASASAAGRQGAAASSADGTGADGGASSASSVDMLEPIGLLPLGCVVGHEWLAPLNALRPKLNEMDTTNPLEFITSTIQGVIESGMNAALVTSESFESAASDSASAAAAGGESPLNVRSSGRRTRRRADDEAIEAAAAAEAAPERPPAVVLKLASFGDPELDTAVVDAHAIARARMFERLRLIVRTRAGPSLVKRRALVVFDEYMRCRVLSHSVETCCDVLRQVAAVPEANSQRAALDWFQQALEEETLGIGGRRMLTGFQTKMRATIRDVAETADEDACEALGKEFEKIWRNCGAASAAFKRNRGSEAYSAVNDQLPEVLANLMTFIRKQAPEQEEAAFSAGRRNMESVVRRVRRGYYNGRASGPSDFASTIRNLWAQHKSGCEATSAAWIEADTVLDHFEQQWWRIGGDTSRSSRQGDSTGAGNRDGAAHGASDEWTSHTVADLSPLERCLQVLRRLKIHPSATPFLSAVDLAAAPGYSDIIDEPMDLGEVSRRIRNGLYVSTAGVDRFAMDIRLIWSNCKTYNAEDSDVWRAADAAAREFEMLWSVSSPHETRRTAQRRDIVERVVQKMLKHEACEVISWPHTRSVAALHRRLHSGVYDSSRGLTLFITDMHLVIDGALVASAEGSLAHDAARRLEIAFGVIRSTELDILEQQEHSAFERSASSGGNDSSASAAARRPFLNRNVRKQRLHRRESHRAPRGQLIGRSVRVWSDAREWLEGVIDYVRSRDERVVGVDHREGADLSEFCAYHVMYNVGGDEWVALADPRVELLPWIERTAPVALASTVRCIPGETPTQLANELGVDVMDLIDVNDEKHFRSSRGFPGSGAVAQRGRAHRGFSASAFLFVPTPRSTGTTTTAVRPSAKRARSAAPIVVARCNLAADEDAEGLAIYPPEHAKAIAMASKIEHIPREQLLWVYYFGEGEEEDERGWFLAYAYDVDFKFHQVKVASTDASQGTEVVKAKRKLLSVQFNWVEAGLDATWHLVSELRIRLANELSGARAKPEFRPLVYSETSKQWVLEDSALEVGSHANIIGRTVELFTERERAASMDEDDDGASAWAPFTVVDVSRATGGSKNAVHLLQDKYGALERLVLSERDVRVHYDSWRSASRQERFNEARAAAANEPCLLEYADQCATHTAARGLRVADAGDGEWRLSNRSRVLGAHCDLLGVELSLKRSTATEWRAVRVESMAVGNRHRLLVLSTGKKELIRLSTVDVRIERPQLRRLVEKIEADARIAAAAAAETMDVDEAPALSSATIEEHGPLTNQSERVRARRLLNLIPREASMGNNTSDLDSKRSAYIGTMVPSRPGAGDAAAYSSQRSGLSDLRVRVRWSFEGRDEWFAGTLRGGAKPQSSASRLCRLVYDDGDEEAIRMPNDAVEVLPESLQSMQWLRVGGAVYAWIPTFGRVSASHKGGGAGMPHFRWVRSLVCGFNADGTIAVRPTGDGDSVNNARAHAQANKDRDRDRDSPELTPFSTGKSRADRLREREDRVQPRRKRPKTIAPDAREREVERRPVHLSATMSRVVHNGQLGRIVSRSRGWVQVKLDGAEGMISIRSGHLQKAPPDAPPYVETPPPKKESRASRKKARRESAAASAEDIDPEEAAAQRAYEIKRRDEKRVQRALAKRAAARAAVRNKVFEEEQEKITIGVRVMQDGKRGVVVSRTKAWLYVRFDDESQARPCRKKALMLETADVVVFEKNALGSARPFGPSYRALAATLGHRSFALSLSEARAAVVEQDVAAVAADDAAPEAVPEAAQSRRVIMATSNIWGSRFVKPSHRAGNGDLLRAQRALRRDTPLRGVVLCAAINHVCAVLDLLRKEVAQAVDMKPQYLSKLMRGNETSKVRINIWEARLNAWVRHVSGKAEKRGFGPSYLELKRAVRHKPFDDEVPKPRKRRGRPSRAAASSREPIVSLAARRSRRATPQSKADAFAREGSSEDEAQSEGSEEEEVAVYTVTGPDMGPLLQEFQHIESRVHGEAPTAGAAAMHVVNAAPSLRQASRDASAAADRYVDTDASLAQLASATTTHPAVKFERLDMLADGSEGYPAWSLPLSMLRPAGDEGVVVKVESARCHVRFPHVDSDVLMKYDTVDELRKDVRCVGAYDARAAADVSAPCSAPILEGESAAAFVRRWREQREFEVGRWPVRVQAHLVVTSEAAVPPPTASTITIGEGMAVKAISIRFSAHLGTLLRLNRAQHPDIDGETVLEHGDTLSLPDCSSLESWVERKLVGTNGPSLVEALQRTHATSSGSGSRSGKDSIASALDRVAASLGRGEYASFAEFTTDVAQCAEDGSAALSAAYTNEMRALRQRTRVLFFDGTVSEDMGDSMPFGQLYWVAFNRGSADRLASIDWKLARLVERTQTPVERETALRLQWVFGERDVSRYHLDTLHVRTARLRSAGSDADIDVDPIILNTRTVGGEEWVDVAINTDSLLAGQQSKRIDLVRGEQGRFASLVELLGDSTVEYGDFPAEARVALLRILFDAACESDSVRASISEQRSRPAPKLSPRRRSARGGAADEAGGAAVAAAGKKLTALGPLPGLSGPDAFADACCRVLNYVVLDVREWQQEKIDALDRTEDDARDDSEDEASDPSKGAVTFGADGAASAQAAPAPGQKANVNETAAEVDAIATLANIGMLVRTGELDSEVLFVDAVHKALVEMAVIVKKFNRHWAHGKACRQEDIACGMKAARWVHATPTPMISQHGLCAYNPFEALREQLGLMMEALPATAFTKMSEWGRTSARRVAWLRLLSRAKTPESVIRLSLLVEDALTVVSADGANATDEESEPRPGLAPWWSSKASRVPPPAAAIRNATVASAALRISWLDRAISYYVPTPKVQALQVAKKLAKAKKPSSAGPQTTKPTSGSTIRWTEEEHKLYLEGVERFDEDWLAISELIGVTKTEEQVRKHGHTGALYIAQLLANAEEGTGPLMNVEKFNRDEFEALLFRRHPHLRKRPQHIGKLPVDHFKLCRAVVRLGGIDTVRASRLWACVCYEIGFPTGKESKNTSAGNQLYHSFLRFVLPLLHPSPDDILPPLEEVDERGGERSRKRKGYIAPEPVAPPLTPEQVWMTHTIDALIAHEGSEPFLNPVTDEVVPGYSDIIAQPMSLSDVQRKIADNAYATSDDDPTSAFAADTRLIFTNCQTFNHEGSEISGVAAELLKRFEGIMHVYGRYEEALDLRCQYRYFCEDDDTIASLCSKFNLTTDPELVLALNRQNLPRCVPEGAALLELDTPLREATLVWLPSYSVQYDEVDESGAAQAKEPSVLAESGVLFIAYEDQTPKDIALSLGLSAKSLLLLNKTMIKGLTQNSKLVEGTTLTLPRRQCDISKAARRQWCAAADATGTKHAKLCASAAASLTGVLNELRATGLAAPFEPPIDDFIAPGYSRIIAIPMALEIIEANLAAGMYTARDLTLGPQKFAAHVRLVFRNCMLYNAAGSSIWKLAEYFIQDFSRIWRARCAGVKRKQRPAGEFAAAFTEEAAAPAFRMTHNATVPKRKRAARGGKRAPRGGIQKKRAPRKRSRSAGAKPTKRARPKKRAKPAADLDMRGRCDHLLDRLMDDDDASLFLEPVNLRAFPTYTDVVETPVDLGTIRAKLKRGVYDVKGRGKAKGDIKLEPFIAEIRLVWKNCKAYNEKGSDIWLKAERMQVKVSSRWRSFQGGRKRAQGGSKGKRKRAPRSAKKEASDDDESSEEEEESGEDESSEEEGSSEEEDSEEEEMKKTAKKTALPGPHASEYKGVIRNSKRSWRAQISVAGVRRKLGNFDNERAAARAYDAYVTRHGLNRRVNFPAGSEEGNDDGDYAGSSRGTSSSSADAIDENEEEEEEEEEEAEDAASSEEERPRCRRRGKTLTQAENLADYKVFSAFLRA